MVANDNGAVFGIRLDKRSGIYEYQFTVDARGPKSIASGSMYLYNGIIIRFIRVFKS